MTRSARGRGWAVSCRLDGSLLWWSTSQGGRAFDGRWRAASPQCTRFDVAAYRRKPSGRGGGSASSRQDPSGSGSCDGWGNAPLGVLTELSTTLRCGFNSLSPASRCNARRAKWKSTFTSSCSVNSRGSRSLRTARAVTLRLTRVSRPITSSNGKVHSLASSPRNPVSIGLPKTTWRIPTCRAGRSSSPGRGTG